MDENKVEDEVVATATEPSQDALADEVKKIEGKPKRTRLETLEFNRDRLAKEAAEERKRLGLSDEDVTPLTRADLEAYEAEKAVKTAMSLAGEIDDENERKLVLHHLENTIKPSGNAETDLRNAKILVDAVKSRQTIEELARRTEPKTSSGTGAPPKPLDKSELTSEEETYRQAFGLTKEQVISARK